MSKEPEMSPVITILWGVFVLMVCAVIYFAFFRTVYLIGVDCGSALIENTENLTLAGDELCDEARSDARLLPILMGIGSAVVFLIAAVMGSQHKKAVEAYRRGTWAARQNRDQD